MTELQQSSQPLEGLPCHLTLQPEPKMDRDWIFIGEPQIASRIKVRDIVSVVADETGISVCDIVSQRRQAPIVTARFIVCFLARDLTTRSFPEIGRVIGGRDHSTIMHGVNSAVIRMQRDTKFAGIVAACRSRLINRGA